MAVDPSCSRQPEGRGSCCSSHGFLEEEDPMAAQSLEVVEIQEDQRDEPTLIAVG